MRDGSPWTGESGFRNPSDAWPDEVLERGLPRPLGEGRKKLGGTQDNLCYKTIMTREERRQINEENRKIRYLRFLVDFSILSIQQENLSFDEASELVEDVKRAACGLFPGKEEVFELIYRPRFNRVIQERFGPLAEREGA